VPPVDTEMNAARAEARPRRKLGVPGARRYALAVLLVLAGLGVQAALSPSPSLIIPLLVSLLAVIVTAYMAGPGPALFATAANLVVNCHFFGHPRFSFAVAGAEDRWLLITFALGGIGVSLLSQRLLRSGHFTRVALLLASSLLLLAVALLVWFDFESSRAAESRVEHTYQVLDASQLLFSTIQDADARQRGYLLTGEQQYLDRYRQLVLAEQDQMKELQTLTSDNATQQVRLTELDGVVNARLAQLEKGISARHENGIAAAIQAVRAGEGAHLMTDIRTVLGAVEAEEHRLLIQRSQSAAAQAAGTRGVLAAGTAVLIALLIFAGVTIESDVRRLQASGTMLRRQADLLDKVHEPIVSWELGGAIEYWNHGAQDLYGFRPEQANGRIPHELLHTGHPLGMARIEDLLVQDGRWRGELTHCINGREIIVESLMTLVTEADGRKTVLEVKRDITEEKRAQEEIRQLNQELEQRVKDRTAQLEATNKELEAFSYSVSHDLRAPLRGIDGWSLALLEDYGRELNLEGQQCLQRIRSETQRMGLLIDDLLRLSHLSRVELQHESVDMTSLARNIAHGLREAEPTRHIEFEIQDELIIGGDSRLLHIVLSNLLGNAVKFTGTRALARIEFGETRFQDEPAFYVRDNGVGFDMAHSGMLFGAFQRLHKHTEFSGTGIGLATAQRVLRRHAGRIWADARVQQGATFYFTVGPAMLWERAGDKGEREVSARMV
jgi:PAS domain S-box-containing protein